MANNQVSKIQLRRGLQTDLSPTNELDVGEVAFTTDTNRLFVGSDPSTSNIVSTVHYAQNSNTACTANNALGFPFTNVEILTEFSPTNQAIFDRSARQINTAFIVSCPMVVNANTNSWMPLMIQQFSASGGLIGQAPFTLNFSGEQQISSAKIAYYLVDANTNAPIRTGQFTIFDQLISNTISVVDEATANPYASATNDPNSRYGTVQFRALVSAGTISLFYLINMTGITPIMYFRIEQPNFSPAPTVNVAPRGLVDTSTVVYSNVVTNGTWTIAPGVSVAVMANSSANATNVTLALPTPTFATGNQKLLLIGAANTCEINNYIGPTIYPTSSFSNVAVGNGSYVALTWVVAANAWFHTVTIN